jgi:hypothetical protein
MAYRLRMRLRNLTSAPLTTTIPSGSVFEVIDPLSRVQNLMTSTSTTVVIPAGGAEIVEIDSWCMNRSFSPPRGTPMRVTPFRSTRQYSGQDEVWGDLGRRK